MILERKTLEALLVHLLVFLLLCEWLYPLKRLAVDINLPIFIVFLILCFLLSYFKFPIPANLLIVSLYIIIMMNFYHFKSPGPGLFWPNEIFADLFFNLDLLFAQEWFYLTNSFRTLLLFILLGLTVYLLHYWVMIRKFAFFFVLITVTYLAILDTFTPFDAKFAIIRTFLFGLCGLGIIAYYRLADREQLFHVRIFQGKGLLLLMGVVFFTTSLGILVPKAGPKWPDPVPFLKSLNTNPDGGERRGEGISYIGYDEDDSYLGGPFLPSDTRVFTVYSRHSQYWRIETKDVYTGKGWETSAEEHFVQVEANEERIPIYHVEDEFLDSELYTAFVEVAAGKDHVIYPYGAENVQLGATPVLEENESETRRKITGYLGKGRGPYFVDPVKEKLDFGEDFENYSMTYRRPSYDISRLRSVRDASGIDENFLQRYTQLPEQLPERVRELAVQLTADSDNWYDRAKDIEMYLQSFEFTYETEDVAIPGEEDDYVDQFLFETKKGYCDNFSTSMVVLLRSIGIPARWVKGYTDGDIIDRTIIDYQLFEIKNNHAHSWVEVYFPGVGWVPFEPTKGFSNYVQFYMEIETDQTTEQDVVDEWELPEEHTQQDFNQFEMDEGTDGASGSGEASFWNRLANFLFVIPLLIVAVLLFVFRHKWLPLFYIVKYKNKSDWHTFQKAYLALMSCLERAGLQRETGVTLRDYARKIDDYFHTEEMTKLTSLYERLVYGNGSVTGEVDWYDAWERLMRRTGRE